MRFVSIDDWGYGSGHMHLTTTLGSCVSVCLWAPQQRVGAMNHFLLPHSGPKFPELPEFHGFQESSPDRGSTLTDMMLQALLQKGLPPTCFKAVIIGGATSDYDHYQIGTRNVEAAAHTLTSYSIPFEKICIGGHWSRKVIYAVHEGTIEIHRLQMHEKSNFIKKYSFERGYYL